MEDYGKKALAVCGIVLAYFIGKKTGKKKGYQEGKKKGEFFIQQAKEIQVKNAEYVHEQYEIINKKIREINRAQEQIDNFYEGL